jgi:hypothetical protein
MLGTIAFMLAENYAPLSTRLKAIYQRLTKIPAYYEAAKGQLKNPALVLTDLAIQQNLGGLSVFESDLRDSLKNPICRLQKRRLSRRLHNKLLRRSTGMFNF